MDIRMLWHSNYDYQAVRFIYSRPENDREFEARERRLKGRLRKLEKDESERSNLIESLKRELAE